MVNSKIAHPANMLHGEVVCDCGGGRFTDVSLNHHIDCGRMVVGFTFTCIVSTY